MVSVFDRFKESVVRNQSALAGSGEAPTSISGGRSLVGLFFLGKIALWVIIGVMFMVTYKNYTDARGVPLKRI